MTSVDNLLEFDKEHIWHPYTSMIDPLPVFLCEKAKGFYIFLESGECLIDGMSSWWCAVHGYNNPRLNRAAREQIAKVSHVMFGGLTHRPAIELGRKLVEILPQGLNRIFYSDSGSVSVEVAIKMAIQYQYSKNKTSKNKIATILGGYHGDTWHAMSVCDPMGGMHSLYNGRLTPQYFAEMPRCGFYDEWDENDFNSMKKLLDAEHENIAAVIVEPIVQGAGGMRFYHPNYLVALREICTKYDVLLIADEIATGFGRTGKMFACNHANITPDIICLGKALTGGYMSFAATVACDKVALSISSASPHSFMHGPTFMANPVAAAVACESLDIITENHTLTKIHLIEKILKVELEKARLIKGVKDIRVLGAIGVLEMEDEVDMASMQAQFVKHGVWIRPFGRLVYIMPQYIITASMLRRLCISMLTVVAESTKYKDKTKDVNQNKTKENTK